MTWDNANTSSLAKALLALRNEREAKCFLRDLLTENELVEFGNRWQAARLLSRAVPYVRIQSLTGLSSTTVARISKWLYRGKGGYKLMLKRLFGTELQEPAFATSAASHPSHTHRHSLHHRA